MATKTTVQTNGTFNTNPSPAKGEEDDPYIALYVTLPAVILVGLLAVVVFIIVRKKRKQPCGVFAKRENSVSVTGGKNKDSNSNNNVDHEKSLQSQYYNTTLQKPSTVSEKELMNGNARKIAGIVEDRYGFGIFVKKQTVTGIENYAFVENENQKPSVCKENIYVNAEEEKTETDNNDAAPNQNMYSFLEDVGRTKIADQTCEYSLYDHTVVRSSHIQTDREDERGETNFETEKRRPVIHRYVNVEVKEEQSTKKEDRKVRSSKSCDNSASTNIPFYLDLMSEADADVYCNCEVKEQRIVKLTEVNSKVSKVSKEKVNPECYPGCEPGGENTAILNEDSHDTSAPSKLVLSGKDAASSETYCNCEYDGKLKTAYGSKSTNITQSNVKKDKIDQGIKAPSEYYYNVKSEGKQIVDHNNPSTIDHNNPSTTVNKSRIKTASSENYCNRENDRQKRASNQRGKHRIEDVTEDDVDCDNTDDSINHHYFVLEKAEYPR